MELSTRGSNGQDFLVPASHKHTTPSLCLQEMELSGSIQEISDSPSESFQSQAMVHSLHNGNSIVLLRSHVEQMAHHRQAA